MRRLFTVMFLASMIMLVIFVQGCLADHHQPDNSDAISVEVTRVSTQNIPIEVDAVGTLAAFEIATLSAAEDGQVEKVFFNNGQDVKKGDVIIQLNQDKAVASLASAKAALKLAQYTLARYLEVQNSGGVSNQLLNKAQADVAAKMADVKTAEAALNLKKIIAPFDGTLGEIKVNVGDYIKQGSPVVQLVSNNRLKVQYQVPQRYISELKIGQSANVTFDGLQGKVFQAKVTFISPAISENTRTVTVEATLDNKGGALSPGMFAEITQVIGVDKNSLVVPEQAITASIEGDFVYKIVDGKALSTKIKIGTRIKGYAQILSGLKEGDVVVTAGIQKLSDGSKVKITNPTSPPVTTTGGKNN